MNVFEINTYGTFSIQEKTKEFYKMLVGGIIFYIIYFFATKYTIGSKGYFIFLTLFLTMLYISIFVVVPITLKVRINKVVRKIQVENNRITFATNKELVYNKKDVRLEEVRNRFTGFSTRSKDGILIKTKTGKEYWIIEDFYNDFETLKKVLKL